MYNDVIWRHPYDDYHEGIPSLHSNSEGSMGHRRGGIADRVHASLGSRRK